MSYCAPEIQDCFADILHVKGNCESKQSTSGIYLNDVGISLPELNEIVGNEYKDGEELFTEKRNFAVKAITATIHSHLQDKYKAKTLLEGQRIGQFQDNLVSVAAEAKLKGIYFELCNETSFVDFFLNFFEVQFDFSGSVNIYLYNIMTGMVIDTFSVDAVAQEVVQVVVNKTYKSDRKKLKLFLCYDATTVPSYKTFSRDWFGICPSCVNYWCNNSYVKSSGATCELADDKIYKNLSRTEQTYGLSANYSVFCNHEDWLCSFNKLIALPLAFYTAKEICDYASLVTSRQNSKTVIASTDWTKRSEMYAAKYAEAIDGVLQNIRLPKDEKCFECKEKIKYAIQIP